MILRQEIEKGWGAGEALEAGDGVEDGHGDTTMVLAISR